MKKFRVSVREVHISVREVELDDMASRDEIIDAAESAEEIDLEYSHTISHDLTEIEEIK